MRSTAASPGAILSCEKIKGDSVYLHQDLRDTESDWFYWCFRLRRAEGRDLQFIFTKSRTIGVRGPAVSTDGGVTWRWLGNATVNGNSFSYTVPDSAPEVRLSFAMPYQEADWLRFLNSLNKSPLLTRRTLCTTAKGRTVEYILLGRNESEPLHRAALTCRHHCCEMMASYTLEGLIQWVVEDSGVEARWVRDNVQFFIVPFADKDGVEDGDQGKNRLPRDHARGLRGEKYIRLHRGNSQYSAGLGRKLPARGAGPALPVDCRRTHHEVIHIVGHGSQSIEREQRRFSEIIENLRTGPLPFSASDFMPFGTSWNTADNYKKGMSFSSWFAELPGIALSASFEIPYANAGGAEVNQQSARLFGRDLGTALAAYLRTLPGE